jgi:tetratricopeptide (TPR) repeat protein
MTPSPARPQETFDCSNWRLNPARAVDGCTRLLTYLGNTGSAHWGYKEQGFAFAYFARGSAHAALGEHDLAIADFTQSIRNGPSAAAYNNRGHIHMSKGDIAAARSDFQEAVRLDPTNDIAKRNLAAVEAAKRRATPSPEQEAGRRQSRDLIGCIKGGDFNDILAACDRALYAGGSLTVSQRAEAFASRGRVQLYRKQYVGAADDLGRAVELRPDIAAYRKDLGEALAGQGKPVVADRAPSGDSTELVRRTQAALARLGYAPGAADGKAGPRTVAAVQAYQRAVGVAVDGKATPELVTRLEAKQR